MPGGLILTLLFSFLAGPVMVAHEVELSGRAMGTTWRVKYATAAASPPLEPEAVAREVSGCLEQLEQLLSTYRPDSELSRFNRFAETGWFSVAPEVAWVAAEARAVSGLTGGAYDATVLPLVERWGFGPHGRAAELPGAAELAVLRRRVDWRRLEVRENPPALRKTEAGVGADFSSLVKGYAADAASARLARLGAPRHLVQVGGDMRSGGADWPVAIERPLEERVEVEAVVTLAGDALSTSGDYRNAYRVGARRYGHIIDPRSGAPVEGALASVSVIHASCARSSALATALFVLGPEEGWRLAEREGIAALFLVRSGAGFERRMTPAFARRLRGP